MVILNSFIKVMVTFTILLLTLTSFGIGFKHELWLNKVDSNESLYFDAGVADASDYYWDFMEVESCCVTGKWYIFEEANFTKFWLSFGYITSGNVACAAMNFSTINSFRHWGASDTTTDAISLYTEQNYSGDEILVTESVLRNIEIPIQSLTATGTSSWMLFEGQDLGGKSLCYHVPKREEPTDNFIYNWDYLIWLEMETIGSVFKGCNLTEIELYKETSM